MAALRAARVRQFVEQTLAHLETYHSEAYDALGRMRAHEWVEYALVRARVYEIKSARNVQRYVDLMVTFGRDFDTDPAIPWAAGLLAIDGMSETVRMNRLCQRALATLDDAERM